MNNSYEEANKKLETIIEKIENGSINIDDLSTYVCQAKELISFCKMKLTKTEEEIEKIINDINL